MIIGALRAEEARIYDTYEGYHVFHTAETQDPYGSFEIFWDDGDNGRNFDGDGETVRPGWYWAPGFPGCLWDGEPTGPFSTSRDALEDADEWHPEFDPE